MPFDIVRNDITNMRVDAIVNTANPQPVIGSGVDAAIHAKAGPLMLTARKVIGTMNTGEACVTPGFRLPCKHVIHTVGPVWHDGCHGEAYLLRQCYEHSLKLARRHRCKSVAFPLISTGNYGFPKQLALQIAVDTIREFLFLGANIDAAKEAARFGIMEDRAVNYHCDSKGTALNYEVVADTISDVRACRPIQASWKKRIVEDFKKRK